MLKLAFAGFRHGHIYSLFSSCAARDDIEIVGAWEDDPLSRAEAEAKGVVFTHDSLEDLLENSGADAIAIGERYGVRGGIAISALKAGKHVISDKPLCTSLEELACIRGLCEEKNLAVGIMLDLRDSENTVTAKAAIDAGLIGKINNIGFEGQHPLNYGSRPQWYFEPGMQGGTVNDIAVHGIDLVRVFTGSDLDTVHAAVTWNFYAKEVPDFKDSAQFLIRLTSGAGVMADVSYAAPGSQGYSHSAYWHFRLWGEKGMMEFCASAPGVKVWLDGENQPRLLDPVKPQSDYIDRFVASVSDPVLRPVSTKDMLDSSEQVLRIQAVADR